MFFGSKSDNTVFEKRLGDGAKLAYSFCLLEPNGKIIKKEGFRHTENMPMASIMKVPVALLVLQKVFLTKDFSLTDLVKIKNTDFTPGPPWNTLDRYFFIPWEIEETRTIDELLTLMLRESDNTATDKLLGLVGGVDAVNDLMRSLHLEGYSLHSTTRQLLSNYFEFNPLKTPSNILSVGWELLSGFTMRATEKSLFIQNNDVCTPDFMVNLMTMLTQALHGEGPSWLGAAAKILFDKMQQCVTGLDMVRKSANPYGSHIKRIGDKTGSIGGIVNDAAFIQFDNEEWMILSIHTCFSPLEKAARTAVIADLAADLLEKNLNYQKDLLSIGYQ